jgi:hypothetical protein
VICTYEALEPAHSNGCGPFPEKFGHSRSELTWRNHRILVHRNVFDCVMMYGRCVLVAVYSLIYQGLFMVYLTTPSLAVGDAKGSDGVN